jgi:hypothetical protein
VDSSTAWRKSSSSGAGNACVEIRHDLLAVRDSKNPGGPAIDAAGIRTLIQMVKVISR